MASAAGNTSKNPNKPARKLYTTAEEEAIVIFLKGRLCRLGGHSVWAELERSGLVHNRTAESLKSRYNHYILPNLVAASIEDETLSMDKVLEVSRKFGKFTNDQELQDFFTVCRGPSSTWKRRCPIEWAYLLEDGPRLLLSKTPSPVKRRASSIAKKKNNLTRKKEMTKELIYNHTSMNPLLKTVNVFAIEGHTHLSGGDFNVKIRWCDNTRSSEPLEHVCALYSSDVMSYASTLSPTDEVAQFNKAIAACGGGGGGGGGGGSHRPPQMASIQESPLRVKVKPTRKTSEAESENELYEVTRISDHAWHEDTDVLDVFVHWKGYTPTWIPIQNVFPSAHEVLRKYISTLDQESQDELIGDLKETFPNNISELSHPLKRTNDACTSDEEDEEEQEENNKSGKKPSKKLRIASPPTTIVSGATNNTTANNNNPPATTTTTTTTNNNNNNTNNNSSDTTTTTKGRVKTPSPPPVNETMENNGLASRGLPSITVTANTPVPSGPTIFVTSHTPAPRPKMPSITVSANTPDNNNNNHHNNDDDDDNNNNNNNAMEIDTNHISVNDAKMQNYPEAGYNCVIS